MIKGMQYNVNSHIFKEFNKSCVIKQLTLVNFLL